MSIYYEKHFAMLCVDPGLRGCGVAFFRAGTLIRAGYVTNPVIEGRGYAAHKMMGLAVVELYGYVGLSRLVMEHPRIYPGAAQQKGDLNDLIDVACVGAAIASNYPVTETETLYPADWKGNVPKEVMTARISRAIANEERAGIEKCYASLTHNVLDAIGIGLFKLGRINKKSILND